MKTKAEDPNNAIPEFVTPDLYLASFLLARGNRVARTLPVGSRFEFSFNGGVSLDSDKSDYYNNEAVGVRDFVSAIFTLKRVMHEVESLALRANAQ